MAEFITIALVRTKKSVAYFPKTAFILLTAFILYRMNHVGAYLKIAHCAVCCHLLAAVAYMSVRWEIPILVEQQLSFDCPRLVYQVLVGSRAAFPELWMMFMRVNGRGYFSREELGELI